MFLESVDSATVFYAKQDFVPIAKDAQIEKTYYELPYWIDQTNNKTYLYSEINNQPSWPHVTAGKQNRMLHFFSNHLIPMLYCPELVKLVNPQQGGAHKKVKYKSYYYKIRKDRYGLYITTKNEGRVSLTKVLKSSSNRRGV